MKSLTKYIAGTSSPITPPQPSPVAEYTLTSAAYVSAGIYRASDSEPKTLLRTLFAYQYQQAGLQYLYWDGLDDQGNNIVATNDYEGKVLSHNMQADWSVVGNSSLYESGLSVMNSYSWFVNMAISGDNIYIGESFNEGGARAAFKVLRSSPQVSIDILPYATDPNASNPNDTDLSTEYMCTNGTNVFWGGTDPYAAYHTPPRTGASWVFATSVATDTNVALSAGTSEKCGIGKTYPNAIDVVIDQPTNIITGMACNGSYLWVARGSQNEIKAYNATTGALVTTITGFTNPRELVYDSSNGGRVWFISGTNSIVKGVVNAGTGNIISGALNINNFPTNKLTLAIDNSTATTILAIAVGGTTQQVWGWNVSAASPSYSIAADPLFKLGQLGGYATNATAANDRFTFTDNSTGQIKGLNQCYITYDSSGNLYVGDVGSVRCQIFDSSRAYVDTIQMFGTVYGVSLNLSDASRGYGEGREFDMVTKEMTYNWMAQIPGNYFSQGYNLFRWTSTLSNGRTYATLEEIGVAPADTFLFEMTSAGILRDTGVMVNKPASYFGNYMDKDFTIWDIYSATGYGVGQTPVIRKSMITSFDGSNNPVYGAYTTVCTLQAIQTTDAIYGAGDTSFHGITDDGIVILKNKEITTTALYRLEGYDLTTGDKVWSTFRPNTRAGDFAGFLGYSGSFPDARYFERGNMVNTNTFNDVQVVENLAILVYNGEGWKAKQTNYFNMYHTIGLPVIQFGTDRVTSEAIGPIGRESSGNGFSIRLSKVNNTLYRCVGGDESVHSAVHKWEISGIDTIAIQTVAITPPTFAPQIGTNLLSDVVFNSILSTTGNITLSNPLTSTWTAQSGIQSYDSYEPDVYLYLDAGSNNGATRYVDLDLPNYNPSLTSWQVFGQINWGGFYGPENTSYSPTGVLEVLDDQGLIITRLGLGQTADSTYKLIGGNNFILSTLSDDVVVNTLGKWQAFNITTGSGGATITYGNYTPVLSTIVDSLAHWDKPTTVRLLVRDLNTFHYGARSISIKLTRYVDAV